MTSFPRMRLLLLLLPSAAAMCEDLSFPPGHDGSFCGWLGPLVVVGLFMAGLAGVLLTLRVREQAAVKEELASRPPATRPRPRPPRLDAKKA